MFGGFRVDGTILNMSFRWGAIKATFGGLCHLRTLNPLERIERERESE